LLQDFKLISNQPKLISKTKKCQIDLYQAVFTTAPDIPSMNAVLKFLTFFDLARNSLQTYSAFQSTLNSPIVSYRNFASNFYDAWSR